VIGAGPAGVTVARGLVRSGARVVLLESGDVHTDPAAQELNDGLADGPVIRQRGTYLREGRRRQIQGSASIWGPGWMMPLWPIDFERRPWVEHSGWPVTADEMAPYMQRAAETFGFDPFDAPQPVDGSLVRLSYRFPQDPMLFRSAYLDLLRDPLFDPQLGTTAVGLATRGDRVESVRAVRTDGSEVRVKADRLVLAAGGVENARFLLLHERVLGVSAMTGRCFMEHPHVLAGSIRLTEPDALRSYLELGRPQLDVFALDPETQSEHGLLNVMVQVRPRDSLDSTPVSCELYTRAEQAPNEDSRVVLSEKEDRLGQPLPILHWRLREQDWNSILQTAELVGAELERNHGGEGAEVSILPHEPWPFDPVGPSENQSSAWGNHHMGTTRISEDPSDGVVDADCRLHGTANLYVAGSSVFPTGSCANPTFTIVAMAHRLVDHLSGANGSA
jgi:choline dehydrogenase-like flavoprotein